MTLRAARSGAWQYYTVTDDVWLAAGMPPASERSPGGDFLCYNCLEARLGRKLTPRDFSDAPINRLNPRASDGAPFFRSLRSYQERAATYLYESDSAFLIAPLGAGKGAAALTAIADLIRDGHRRHALVVAPKLVATTVWPAEIRHGRTWRTCASRSSTEVPSAGVNCSPPQPIAR